MATEEALCRYVSLSAQREAIRRSMSPNGSPTSPSVSASPSSAAHHAVGLHFTPLQTTTHAMSAYPLPPYSAFSERRSSISGTGTSCNCANLVTAHAGGGDDGDSSSKALFEISQQIKATLTGMLNSSAVKQDHKLRTWVQARLMDTEHDMKRERRRRSSSSADRCIAMSIAGCLEHGSCHRAIA